MILDAQIQKLTDHFGIKRPEDWARILPSSVLALHGIGQQTLNHLRLHLAARGLTLRGDQTPAFWQQHLSDAQIGTVQIAGSDEAAICPFRVMVDTREQLPWTFQGMRTDADQGYRPLLVDTLPVALGDSVGDYAIDGLAYHCHIERKSMNDAHGTILGWGERREQFQRTLANLAGMKSSAVVVECSFQELVKSAPSRGKKSAKENAKILHRQVLAWMDDYRVPWVFCDTRRLAEITAFRWMYRYWEHFIAESKAANKQTLEVVDL